MLFEMHDILTGNNLSLKTLDADKFLTNPIFVDNKVYFASGDSIEVFNTTNGQFETSSFIGAQSSYGWAKGSLIQASNGLLYGHTANFYEPLAKSSIFSYDVINGSTAILAEFDIGNRNLNEALIEHNNKLYGTSNYGGTNSNGYIFSLDLTTNQVDTIYHFDGVNDGRIFEGSFTLYNNMLYAVSYSGGQNGNGTLVRFDPSNNTLTTLEHLTVENGRAFKATPSLWIGMPLSINNNVKEKTSFSIYPNPTNSNFTINYEDYDQITIHDISGKLIKTYNKSNVYNINQLESGVYFINIIKNKNQIGSERLIISK